MKILAIVFATCFAMLPAFGRIGESEAQCIARYGSPISVYDSGTGPISETARSDEFVKDDFFIVVTFFEGKSVCEAYKKKKVPFVDSEMTEIISKNGGSDWKEAPNSSYPRLWEPVDGSSEPGASMMNDTLVIWAVGGRNALALLKDAQDKENQTSAQHKAQQSTSGL